MISIYTNRQNSGEWIMQNDWYFNLYTGNEKFTEEDKARHLSGRLTMQSWVKISI